MTIQMFQLTGVLPTTAAQPIIALQHRLDGQVIFKNSAISAGTTTTFTSSLTVTANQYTGAIVQIASAGAGPDGQVRQILSHTAGPNAVFTVVNAAASGGAPFTVAVQAADTFTLYTPSSWRPCVTMFSFTVTTAVGSLVSLISGGATAMAAGFLVSRTMAPVQTMATAGTFYQLLPNSLVRGTASGCLAISESVNGGVGTYFILGHWQHAKEPDSLTS